MAIEIMSEGLDYMDKAKNYNQWLFSVGQPYLKGEVLEVGCGIGTLTDLLLKVTETVTCIDTIPEYITEVQKRLPVKNAFVGDITDLNTFWKDKLYDGIFCSNVLEHIPDDELALRNMHKILKKDGYLILIVPAHQFLHNSLDRGVDHKRRYSVSSLRTKCQNAGFSVVRAKYMNITGTFGWFLNGNILRRNVISGGHMNLYDKVVPFFRFLESICSPPFGLSVAVVLRKP
ncbi:MAG: class I SAM-dependent methyltransferase [Planctomycetota bacterium]|nr:class I SAM-dependent methyltransferase [Planctomycetota bacterium]